MGALAGMVQVKEVKERVMTLAESAEIVYGSLEQVEVMGSEGGKGAFMSPIVLVESSPFERLAVHEVEAFGPVSTIMPYKNLDEAIELANMGKGYSPLAFCRECSWYPRGMLMTIWML